MSQGPAQHEDGVDAQEAIQELQVRIGREITDHAITSVLLRRERAKVAALTEQLAEKTEA